MIDDAVIAAARADDVRTAAAVNRVASAATGDDVDARRAGNRVPDREPRRIDVLEVGDACNIAHGLIRIGEIDRTGDTQQQRIGAGTAVNRGFRAPIGGDIIAGAGIDDVRSAIAIYRVVARACRDRVARSRTGDGNGGRQGASIEVLEIPDIDAVARG